MKKGTLTLEVICVEEFLIMKGLWMLFRGGWVEPERTHLSLSVLFPRRWLDYQDPEAHSSVSGRGRGGGPTTSPGHETQRAPEDPALCGSDAAGAGGWHR